MSSAQFWIFGLFVYGFLAAATVYLIVWTLYSIRSGKGLEDTE